MSNGRYKIQKGIPLPVPRSRTHKYPFLEMEVGDSFTVAESEMRNTQTAMQDYKRRYNLYFVSKTYWYRGKQRLRVWRVEAPSED